LCNFSWNIFIVDVVQASSHSGKCAPFRTEDNLVHSIYHAAV
jgi:hypothetical protein